MVADYKDFIASSDFVPFIIPTTSQSATGISTQNIQPSRELLEVNIDAESGPGQHDERAITLAQKVPGIGSMGVSDLNYPLSLFDGFPDPPPATIVEDLTRTFEVAFLRKVPFLSSLTNLDSSILAGLIGSAPVAPYLAFGRALVGTLVSKNEDCQRWASNLYKTTLKLFVGSVELDNRTSRNIFWYEAVSLTRKIGRRCGLSGLRINNESAGNVVSDLWNPRFGLCPLGNNKYGQWVLLGGMYIYDLKSMYNI